MFDKNKNNLAHITEKAVLHIGIYLMAAATIIGMTELTDRQDIRILNVAQPAFAFDSGVQPTMDHQNLIRREREEAGRHAVSYGVTMRTPPISGKR